MSSTILTVFLEGIFINEAFYHEIEHRIFELEPWKSLEDNPEIEIEAFAYSTGILFRFRSFSVDLSQIQEAFDTLKEKKIPDFSISEKKRFLRELQDRKMDQEADFDEWAGAEFLKSFEIPPILENIQTFGDFISRISIVTHNREGTLFYENRLREISQFPKVQKAVLPMKGELFHSYILFPVQNTLEAVSSIIFLNAVRSRLKKLFREPGESYDICMGLRFEGSYLFADYFWR